MTLCCRTVRLLFACIWENWVDCLSCRFGCCLLEGNLLHNKVVRLSLALQEASLLSLKSLLLLCLQRLTLRNCLSFSLQRGARLRCTSV